MCLNTMTMKMIDGERKDLRGNIATKKEVSSGLGRIRGVLVSDGWSLRGG